MRATQFKWLHKALTSALCAVVVATGAVAFGAPGSVNWLADVEQAKQIAAQSNRLVLVHVGATWCNPCMQMERQVFTTAGLGQALERDYVPVKLDMDDDATRIFCKDAGVRSIPADIVITPAGQVVFNMQGFRPANDYVGKLAGAANSVKQQMGQMAAGQQPHMESPSDGMTVPADNPNAGGQVAQQQQPKPHLQLPPGTPPLALDGFCPVHLSDRRQWTQGDPRWGVIHRGRLFLFAGQAEQQAFWSDPDRYTPVASGNDTVQALDFGRAVEGRRDFGVFYEGRVYLFAGEESLQKFYQTPERYTAEVMQARLNRR